MTWYRLIITALGRPDEKLQVLCDALRDDYSQDGHTLPDDAALLARPTDSGGYEVRFTRPLLFQVESHLPDSYIQPEDPPQGSKQWTLELGDARWLDVLAIRPTTE